MHLHISPALTNKLSNNGSLLSWAASLVNIAAVDVQQVFRSSDSNNLYIQPHPRNKLSINP